MLVEEKVVVSPNAGSGVEDVIVDKPEVSVPTIIVSYHFSHGFDLLTYE